jgi:hypothetical protein
LLSDTDTTSNNNNNNKDAMAKQVAKIFVTRCLPLLFPDSKFAVVLETDGRTMFCIERAPMSSFEKRSSAVPAPPQALRQQLLREVRDEIMGRRSVHSLLSLSASPSITDPSSSSSFSNGSGGDPKPGIKRATTTLDVGRKSKRPKTSASTTATANASSPNSGADNASVQLASLTRVFTSPIGTLSSTASRLPTMVVPSTTHASPNATAASTTTTTTSPSAAANVQTASASTAAHCSTSLNTATSTGVPLSMGTTNASNASMPANPLSPTRRLASSSSSPQTKTTTSSGLSILPPSVVSIPAVELESLRTTIAVLQRDVEQLRAIIKRKERATQMVFVGHTAEINMLKAQYQTLQQLIAPADTNSTVVANASMLMPFPHSHSPSLTVTHSLSVSVSA